MLARLARIGLRVGLAVALVAMIALIVTVARLTNNSPSTSPHRAGQPDTTGAVDPTTGDDGEVLPTASNVEDGAIAQVAAEFTTAWLRRDRSSAAWHERLVPVSTPTLAESLKNVDPKSVPATRTIGEPRLVLRSALYAQVSITVDSGSLLLSLFRTDSGWLVDTVDWDRA